VETSHNRRSGMMGRTVLGNISQPLKLSLLPGHACSCLFKTIYKVDRQSDYPKPTHLHIHTPTCITKPKAARRFDTTRCQVTLCASSTQKMCLAVLPA
jgi:hypothetical protein